jgi:hypothetical protein
LWDDLSLLFSPWECCSSRATRSLAQTNGRQKIPEGCHRSLTDRHAPSMPVFRVDLAQGSCTWGRTSIPVLCLFEEARGYLGRSIGWFSISRLGAVISA